MQYTDELKTDAVLMMSQGTKIAEVSHILNIPASTLYRWRGEQGPKSEQSAEVLQLQQRVQELSEQLAEILPWARRKIKAEAKLDDYTDSPKPGLVLGRR